MDLIVISAIIGIAFGLLVAYFFTGGVLAVLTLIVAAIVLYGWMDAQRVGRAGGSAVLGMLLIFGPGIVCFLATMWGTHLYFVLASPDIDWSAVRSWIFR